jgi:hypothetical protein
MANPLDTDAGSELFTSYEAELKLVQADLSQKLDQIPELSGEPRKAAISQAERALEEANELVRPPPPADPGRQADLDAARPDAPREEQHPIDDADACEPAIPQPRDRRRWGEAAAAEFVGRQGGAVRGAVYG